MVLGSYPFGTSSFPFRNRFRTEPSILTKRRYERNPWVVEQTGQSIPFRLEKLWIFRDIVERAPLGAVLICGEVS